MSSVVASNAGAPPARAAKFEGKANEDEDESEVEDVDGDEKEKEEEDCVMVNQY